MPKQVLSIANYRVSSDEQLLSNSLARQEKVCLKAAGKIGTEIVRSWSGSVSSKAGTNVTRKDLLEMLEYCKQHKSVKYAIFDEYDRFMRSVNEGPYFEVLFQQLGVKVWYASESDTFNGDDAMAKFMRTMSAFKAEGSNEERQRKSIAGQTNALQEGRYPFAPKPGYKKGSETAVQEIDEVRGSILRTILIKIASRQITPTQALVELNDSNFMVGHSSYKMDKFRKILIDPFYAGIVEVNKQVKVRNEKGLHEPLITKEQHYELIKIIDSKKKNQSGPRKNGNPKYPLSNLVTHDECLHSTICRFVGFDHSNGKNKDLLYEKYRCRTCGKDLTREELHYKIEQQFKDNSITQEGLEDLIEALNIVWVQRENQAEQEVGRIKHKLKDMRRAISQQVEAATDPSNALIKDDILASIAKKKDEATDLEHELDDLQNNAENDRETFLRFAFNFVENMGSRFLEISPENRVRCKDIVFPAGFYMNKNNKVYTPEISELYRLATKKKDTEVSEISQMVRVKRL